MKQASPDFHRLLEVFADIFSQSQAGRRGGERSFVIECEKFLLLAGAQDGDARELAEQFFTEVQAYSNGKLEVVCALRTGKPVKLKLHAAGGEEWLFETIQRGSPQQSREEMANFFNQTAETTPCGEWRPAWREYFLQLAEKAACGDDLRPFHPKNLAANIRLIHALSGVLLWKDESLIRYASSAICGDSKALQSMESRLCAMLAAITGCDTLDAFGILTKPRVLSSHGPLELEFGDVCVNLMPLPGPILLSEINLQLATAVRTTAPCCLTIENEDTFLELAKQQTGVFLIHTSFPSAAVRKLISSLPSDMVYYHFGDTDPAGFDILRDLREKTNRCFLPLLMEPDLTSTGIPYSKLENQVMDRLLQSPSMQDLRELLLAMREHGQKTSYEQESIPLTNVVKALHTAMG